MLSKLIIFSYISITICARYQIQQAIIVTGFFNCTTTSNNEHLDVNFEGAFIKEFSVMTTNRLQMFNITFILPNDINDMILPWRVTIEKCKDRSGHDCEYFLGLKFDNFCEVKQMKNQFFSSLYDYFQPPLECPLKKGEYRLENGELDSAPLMKQYGRLLSSNPDVFWKFTIKIFLQNNTEFLCLESAGQLIPLRIRL